MFLFGTEFGLCVLLRCAGCFFGAVEEALTRWTRKALDDGMLGDLFLAALANSIEALHLKRGCKGITNSSIASLI